MSAAPEVGGLPGAELLLRAWASQPCPYLCFGPPAPRAVGEEISVAPSPPACYELWWQPQEADTDSHQHPHFKEGSEVQNR